MLGLIDNTSLFNFGLKISIITIFSSHCFMIVNICGSFCWWYWTNFIYASNCSKMLLEPSALVFQWGPLQWLTRWKKKHYNLSGFKKILIPVKLSLDPFINWIKDITRPGRNFIYPSQNTSPKTNLATTGVLGPRVLDSECASIESKPIRPRSYQTPLTITNFSSHCSSMFVNIFGRPKAKVGPGRALALPR